VIPDANGHASLYELDSRVHEMFPRAPIMPSPGNASDLHGWFLAISDLVADERERLHRADLVEEVIQLVHVRKES